MKWKPKYLGKYYYIYSITKNKTYPCIGWIIDIYSAGYCGPESTQHFKEGNLFKTQKEAMVSANHLVQNIKATLKGG